MTEPLRLDPASVQEIARQTIELLAVQGIGSELEEAIATIVKDVLLATIAVEKPRIVQEVVAEALAEIRRRLDD